MQEIKATLNEVGIEVKSEYHARFSDLPWYDPSLIPGIVLCGAGGIGSWAAIALSRAGYSLLIMDGDLVDNTNLAGQAYGPNAIGKPKAEALRDMCRTLGAAQRISAGGFVDEATTFGSLPIVIAAFDNMKARKLAFEKWKQIPLKNKLFIDGRMLAEMGQVFIVQNTPENIAYYEASLFDDKEVQEQPCSAKATSHCGMQMGSLIMAMVANFCTNLSLKENVRVLPPKMEFMFAMIDFEVEKELTPCSYD